MLEPMPDTNRMRWVRRLFFGAVVALALHLVAVATWEEIAKPGLGRLGRAVAGAATLGSTQLKDAAYRSAALDPSPLPGLILLQIVGSVPLGAFTAFFIMFYRRATSGSARSQFDRRASKAGVSVDEYLLRTLKRLSMTGVVLCVTLAILVTVIFTTIEQATLIRRVFNSDMARLGAKISEGEERELMAQFASIETRADYVALRVKLDQIANARNVRLSRIKTW